MLLRLMLSSALLFVGEESGEEGGETRFYKGNTHTHTLWSDGDGAPEKVAAWYKDHGYHFLVLSDHNVLSNKERWFPVDAANKRLTAAHVAELQERFGESSVDLRTKGEAQQMRLLTLSELRERFEEPGRFRFIQGEEVTATYQPKQPGRSGKPVHINALNIDRLIPPETGETVVETLNRNVDAILANERDDRPVLAHINHPNFGWALTWKDVAAVRSDRFFEVFNGHRHVNNRGNATHESTDDLWDKAMVMRLVDLDLGVLYGLATDDAHRYHGNDPVATPGRGWVMVRSSALTENAIISAMKRGDFYSSSGVVVRDFNCTDRHYRVALDVREGETLTTRFIGTRVIDGVLGPVGEVLMETTGDRPEYTFDGDELYVRVLVTSSRMHPDPAQTGDAQCAWLQPWTPLRP